MKHVPILYVRRGCPWCRKALAFFSSHGVEVEVRDVDQSYPHLKRMIEVSGQSLTPTFEYDDFVVADFSVDELLDELQERPDVQMRLGIADDNPTG
ncbi:glutaredoxin family protein [Congregicoccus parvus]|jgi:glutaredoxin|uniref:glutaredoxin family protein n=1 Tax=Congregicoccus parvus TaxID=3081749 RepID=UPI003FA601C4